MTKYVFYSSKAGDYKKTSIIFTDGDYKDQKLKKDTDYTVEYSGVSGNAPEAGSEINVTLQGKGKYTGKAIMPQKKDLKISIKNKGDLGEDEISAGVYASLHHFFFLAFSIFSSL